MGFSQSMLMLCLFPPPFPSPFPLTFHLTHANKLFTSPSLMLLGAVYQFNQSVQGEEEADEEEEEGRCVNGRNS